MRSGRATPRAPGEAQQPGGSSLAARPRSAAASPASTTAPAYCVVYSSDDSLSDGELHVERRAGSVSAWYQRGSGPRPARLPAHASGSEPDRPHSSLRVVVHDHAGAEGASEDEQEDSELEAAGRSSSSTTGAGEGPQPRPGVTWETNNLFDYLKGLYQQGVEDAQQGAEFDRWAEGMGRSWQDQQWQRAGQLALRFYQPALCPRLPQRGVGASHRRAARPAA